MVKSTTKIHPLKKDSLLLRFFAGRNSLVDIRDLLLTKDGKAVDTGDINYPTRLPRGA